MDPNTTYQSLNFYPCIINDSVNNNILDVNFFYDNASPLDTDYIPPSNFSWNFWRFYETSVMFYISILGVQIKTLNLL